MLHTRSISDRKLQRTTKLWLNESMNTLHSEHVPKIQSLQTASVIYCPTCCHTKMQSMFFNQSSSSSINGCDESERNDAKIDFSVSQQLQQCFHRYMQLLRLLFLLCESFRLQWQHLRCQRLLTTVRFVFIEHFVLQFFFGYVSSTPSANIYDFWTMVLSHLEGI